MDAETLVETWIELRQRGKYKIEALEMLRDEIASSYELSSEEKDRLTTLLVQSAPVGDYLEEVFQILKKYEAFQKAFAHIVGELLAGNCKL